MAIYICVEIAWRQRKHNQPLQLQSGGEELTAASDETKKLETRGSGEFFDNEGLLLRFYSPGAVHTKITELGCF